MARRLAWQLGQKERHLHETASRYSCVQASHRMRAKPWSRTPQARNLSATCFHLPVDASDTGRFVEERAVRIVEAVRRVTRISLAVKVGPYFSAVGEMAARFASAGADGLVLFNRFYQPDFDLEKLEVEPSLALSSSAAIRLPLFWIAALRGRVGLSLGARTGVATFSEVVKYVLAGADVVMTTAALLRHGPGHLAVRRDGLVGWMQERKYASVSELRGAMSRTTAYAIGLWMVITLYWQVALATWCIFAAFGGAVAFLNAPRARYGYRGTGRKDRPLVLLRGFVLWPTMVPEAFEGVLIDAGVLEPSYASGDGPGSPKRG